MVLNFSWLKKLQIYYNLICKTLVSHPGTPCHNEMRICDSHFNQLGRVGLVVAMSVAESEDCLSLIFF